MGKKRQYKKKDLANIYCRGNFCASCTDKNILFGCNCVDNNNV